MPLADALSIAEAHLDRRAVEHHRQAEAVWAALAPHTKDRLSPPEPPKFD
jgi:hypothetical protein